MMTIKDMNGFVFIVNDKCLMFVGDVEEEEQ